MAEAIESAKVVCEGGLDVSQNFLRISELAPGSANSLVNFESSLFGGYRRVDGFQTISVVNDGEVNSTGAEGRILVTALHNSEIIVGRKDQGTNTYSLYVQNSLLGWAKLTIPFTLSSLGVSRIRWATFNFSGVEKIIFVDGTNPPLLYDGINWSQLIVTNSGADAGVNAGGDQLLVRPRFITVFKNHIFLSGDVENPHLVVHSAPSSEFNWTAAAGAGQIIAGFDVVQIYPFRDSLFVFGRMEIKKISVSGTNFIIDDVTHNIGCIASDSVIEISGDLLFLSADGIRPISATEKIDDVNIASVSKKIQSLLVDLIRGHSMDEVTAVKIGNKSQVRFFFSDPGDVDGSANGIAGSLRENSGNLEWEWSELKGIRSTCTMHGYIGNDQYVVHGDYNGKVYRQERGNSFDGLPIFAMYQTTYLDYGDTQRRKTMRNINLFVRPEGNLTLRANISYDWGGTNIVNPAGYTSVSNGLVSTYGLDLVYDGLGVVYGRSTTPVMVTNIQGSFFSCQVTFSTEEIAPSYSIQGMVFEFSVDGRN